METRLDIEALQGTLRTFAAERDWQAFHTPKNLSTALIVEAAELAEIFQWMTPEQSAAAHTDAVVREQIADEVADVLLYLLQIADHTQVDLKRAVGRKLVKNARKHLPVHTGLPVGTAAASTVETHVLVDWENVRPKESDLRALVPDVTDVWIFHGPNQKVDPDGFSSFGSRATPVKIARSGKNALDFHLSFYMGYIASRHPDARFVVVANDKGYGPVVEHAGELGFAARQAGFGAPTSAASKTVTKKAAPTARKTPPKPSSASPTAAAGSAKPKAAAATPSKKTAPKKVAATPTAPQPATKPAANSIAVGTAPAKTTKGLMHVLANLEKTKSRPARQSRLLSSIQSWLGTTPEDPAIQRVFADLVNTRKVTVDEKGAVLYHL